jgi:hypothetical protein
VDRLTSLPPPASPAAPAPGRQPLRSPVGLGALVGGIAVLVGTFAPWVSGTNPRDELVTVNGFDGAGDGSMALLFAVLCLIALASRSVAGSRTRIIQLLPGGLGIIGLLYMIVAWRGLPQTLETLRNLGVDPLVQPWFWIELAGSIIVALAGVAATVLIIRRNPVRRDTAADVDAFDRVFFVRLAIRLGGMVAGLAVGVWLAIQTYGSSGSPFVPAYGLVGLGLGLGAAALVLSLFGPSDQRKSG